MLNSALNQSYYKNPLFSTHMALGAGSILLSGAFKMNKPCSREQFKTEEEWEKACCSALSSMLDREKREGRKTSQEDVIVHYEGDDSTTVPDSLIGCGKLISPTQFRLWAVLRKASKGTNLIAGQYAVRTCQKKLASETGVDVSNFRRTQKQMERKGLISVQRMGLGEPNVIFIKNPIEWLKRERMKTN